MNRIPLLALLVAPLLVLVPAHSALAGQPGKSPVKVFILAGQSNMEGYGSIHSLGEDGKERPGTLVSLSEDPAKASLVRHLRDSDPAGGRTGDIVLEATNDNFGDSAPNVSKKLRVVYASGGVTKDATVPEGEALTLSGGTGSTGSLAVESAFYGDLPSGPKKDVTERVRKLVKDAASAPRWKTRGDVWVRFEERRGELSPQFGAGKGLFGVELEFGYVMAEFLPNQVLILKTAWGGQSLYKDFRPPSAGGEVGPRYREMVETVRKLLADLKAEFPDYDSGGVELAGLVWWHGWNDGCDPEHAVPEYEENLVHLIRDLRKDLGVPRLPVVVGELTGPWVEVGGEWGALRKAQAAAASRPEFAGTVLYVETHDFVRKEEESPGGWPCHEFNNAETYLLVGNALGEAMKKLLAGAGK